MNRKKTSAVHRDEFAGLDVSDPVSSKKFIDYESKVVRFALEHLCSRIQINSEGLVVTSASIIRTRSKDVLVPPQLSWKDLSLIRVH